SAKSNGANGHSNGRGDGFVATYDYPGFQKVRYPKGREPRFRIRHRKGNDWEWGAGGADTSALYRRQEIEEAIALERPILLVEGEKDADALWAIGIAATCNMQGANEPGRKPKWTTEHSKQLAGADLVVLGDHDPAGYAHQDATCKFSLCIAKRVRILKLANHWPGCPKGGDVSDWLAAGHTREELDELIALAPDYDGFGAGDGAPYVEDAPPIAPEDRLITSKASDLEMRGVEWLWPGPFCRGTFR